MCYETVIAGVQGKKARREMEVAHLLDKLQPSMISLSSTVGQVPFVPPCLSLAAPSSLVPSTSIPPINSFADAHVRLLPAHLSDTGVGPPKHLNLMQSVHVHAAPEQLQYHATWQHLSFPP